MAILDHRSYSLADVKSVSILDVCDRLGITVSRRGKHYWCKLRDECNPSTVLHPEHNSFYDFGTQQHGSNIDLVCTVTGKSFPDAVRYLGETFDLTPETYAEKRDRFRIMSRTDYARIGLHADLATKNFVYDIAHYPPDKLLDIELRYQMPMNTLRKEHPETYARIIRDKDIPYVHQLRELYYLDVWNYYSLLQSTGRAFLFYDSERTQAHFAERTNALEQAERSLYKAGQGTGLRIPEPAHYDPLRVISLMLTDRLTISLGTCSKKDLTRQPAHPCTSFSVSHNTFFASDLSTFSYAADLSKDRVTITCRNSDLLKLKTRLHPLSDLDRKIQDAGTKQTDKPKIPAERELSHTR